MSGEKGGYVKGGRGRQGGLLKGWCKELAEWYRMGEGRATRWIYTKGREGGRKGERRGKLSRKGEREKKGVTSYDGRENGV